MRENQSRVKKTRLLLCFDTPKDSDMSPLLAVKNLSCVWSEGDPMFENINFSVNEGDIIVLQARSGTGYVASVRVYLVLIIIIFFITIAFSRPQKDYPLEVYSSSLSISWNCRIQGKVSRVFVITIISHVSAVVSGPPKLMVSLPSIQKTHLQPHDIGVPTYRT